MTQYHALTADQMLCIFFVAGNARRKLCHLREFATSNILNAERSKSFQNGIYPRMIDISCCIPSNYQISREPDSLLHLNTETARIRTDTRQQHRLRRWISHLEHMQCAGCRFAAHTITASANAVRFCREIRVPRRWHEDRFLFLAHFARLSSFIQSLHTPIFLTTKPWRVHRRFFSMPYSSMV